MVSKGKNGNRTRVLFLIEALGEGGAEKILHTLVSNINRSKFEVTVVTIAKAGIYANSIPEIVDHFKYIVNYNNHFVHDLFNKLVYKLIYQFLPSRWVYRLFIPKNHDIECAFCEGIATRIISASSNKDSRKLAWVHTDLVYNHWTRIAYKNDDEENACYSKFDTVACVSRTALDSLKTLYPTLHNLKIVYNPIDESLIRKMASAHSVDRKAGRINMITIGRLVQQKGYDRLIPILGELKKQGLQFFLRILGTGTQEQLLKELILKYGLTQYIELTGFKENPYPYLAASDLFVCSSRSEGYSTAVTEALILGLPVVTTECSGMKELLGDNNEWGLVVPNDEHSLQRALQAVISNPNTLQDLKNKAMARSHDFSLKKLMTAIENTLLG